MKTHLFIRQSSKLVLLYMALFLGYAPLHAVTVTIRGLQDTKGVALDSISIDNLSNTTSLRIGGLSSSLTSYSLDLSATQTAVPVLTVTNQLQVITKSGMCKLLAELSKPTQLTLNEYSIDGKQKFHKVQACNAGTTMVPLPTQPDGIYLLHVVSAEIDKTFKIIYRNADVVTASETQPVLQKAVLYNAGSNWQYTAGDRIQVIVKKGNLKSLVWQGKPTEGTLIQLALPKNSAVFDMNQTLSNGAQINTISFSGVAFYSGCFYASSFYPPGKVADYFGFQYLRDNDPDESGHNTDFLTKAAYHMMHILNETQLQQLIDLATAQDALFTAYATDRLVLIKAFHRYLSGDLPVGTTSLNADSVQALSRRLYEIDGEISYGRALCFSNVIRSLSEEQKDTLYRLGAVGMQTWSMPEKPTVVIPRGLNTWVMSNASEMFSWFLRGADAGIYFCPERQGTYFGGFFMKDAPAVGTPGYAIDMQATANKGTFMLDSILTPSQSAEIKKIYTIVKPSLNGIVACRTKITNELRKAIEGQSISKSDIQTWSAEYGNYDGTYIYTMVDQFVKVAQSLTPEQKAKLVKLRDLDAYPCKEGRVFIYSAESDEPALRNTDFLFK